MSRALRAFAPAKLNLGLEVIRKRRDGYHDIETVFQTLDFGDELLFRDAEEPGSCRLDAEGLPVPMGSENLVRKAWRLVADRAGWKAAGLRITLTKRIPLGSGLGGGSSDAAATLLALNHFWALGLPTQVLEAMALELGSDAPFFLKGGTAIGRGRGERLEPLPPLRRGAFLLVSPGLSISSAWAYEHIKLGLTQNPYRISVEQVKAYLTRFPASSMVIKNRLEDVVFPAHPSMGEIFEALHKAGAVHVSMSGSGSTLYGTFPDAKSAERAREGLGDRWLSWVARPLPDGVRLEEA